MFLMTCQYVDVWPTDCGHDGQETTNVCNPQLALKMGPPLNTGIFPAITELDRREYFNTTTNFRFAANMFTFAIYHRPSICHLSSVCNVRAPYSGNCNFRQCFYAIWYLGHLWPFSKNFTEIVPGKSNSALHAKWNRISGNCIKAAEVSWSSTRM